jgi:hypothetical protein
MRKVYSLTSLLAAAILFTACKKDLDVNVDSLNKAGEEFYFGERVPVWASTTGDKEDVTYSWSATGGTFDGWRTQDLFENLWIAPSTPGDYTVSVTAKNASGSSSTKSTLMKVTRYFFDEFQSVFTLNGNGWSTSNTTNALKNSDAANSTLELTASSSSAPNIRRTLNLSPLKIPFSIRTRLAWKNYFRPSSTIVISLFFEQPSNPNYPYIREIRWEIWPTVNPGTTDNYQIRYETFVPASNVSKFSTVGNTVPNPLPLISPVKGKRADLAMTDGQFRDLSFSVTADNVFHAYIDGNLWFTSNGIKDWLDYAKATYAGFQDPVAKEYRVAFPAKESSKPGTTLVMKSVYINNDGSIIK